jgi:hypothetical protein
MPDTRKSDRWLTPGVIIAALLVAGFTVASVVGSVAYLTARGIDPDPLLKLAGTLVAAAGSVGTFVLQLAQRAQNSKTERNTGVLAGNTGALVGAVGEVADHLATQASVTTSMPPLPPVPAPVTR